MRLFRILAPVAAAGAMAGAAAAADGPGADGAALRKQMGLQPGRWHTVVTLVSAEAVPAAPGKTVPPEAEAALKKQAGRTFETDDCIGAATAPASADGTLVLPGIHIGSGCRYDDVTVQAGRFGFTARCGAVGAGFEAEVTAQGKYSPTSMEAALATRTLVQEAGMRTAITVTTRSTRTGDCPA